MASNFKVMQVIPKLGYGGAETGCYDLAHFLAEKDCKSIIVTSGGPLIKYVRRKKVKIIKLPVHLKNPFALIFNAFALVYYRLFIELISFMPGAEPLHGLVIGQHFLLEENLLQRFTALTILKISLKNSIIA